MKNKAIVALSIVIIAVLCVGTLAACGELNIKSKTDFEGDGEIVTKAEALSDSEYKLVIKNVNVDNGVINIAQKEEALASVSTNTNISDTLSLQVSDGVITVEGKEDYLYKTKDFVINLGAKVNDIEINGAFTLDIDQSKLTEFNIKINGACKGKIKLESLNKFNMVVNGAGNITVEGSSANANICLNGAAQIDAFGLLTQNMDVTLNGAGRINVHATATINATVNGIGEIIYDGAPTNIQSDAKGLGKIKPKE